MHWIPACIIRGGTSKGLFFNGSKLPLQGQHLDIFFLKAMGSPDPYGQQLDGLGGGTSSTSKIVVVTKSKNPNFDVDYLFGQVDIKNRSVDYSGSCGNMAAGVGLFALSQKMISGAKVQNGRVQIRVWQRNINKLIVLTIPCDDKLQPITNGDFELFGVPNKYAEVITDFRDPGDGAQSLIFPTNNPVDQLELSHEFKGRKIQASLVNVGNPTIFVRASDVGLQGNELSLNQNTLNLLQNIRCHGSLKMKIGKTFNEVMTKHRTFSKIAFVQKAKDYKTSQNITIEGSKIDILARILSLGKLHHTFTATGLLSLGACTAVLGSIPNQLLSNKPQTGKFSFNVGHRAGVTQVRGSIRKQQNQWIAEKVEVSSSARLLMRGQIPWQTPANPKL